MKHLYSYILLLRPKNLIIVGVTQWILYRYVLLPYIENPALDYVHFFILVLVTICIAASGFVINDLCDHQYDYINKPQKSFIPEPISMANAWKLYFGIITFGCVLALYLAIYIKNLPLFLLFPGAVLTLYYYSKKWKNSILLGNVVVSLFIAFTAGIVWFAERNSWSSIQILANKYKVAEVFTVYMSLSFIVNLIREIIKDIEDMEGDKSADLTTFPLKYGIISALRLANVLVIFTIVGTLIWLFLSSISTFAMKMYFLIFVLSPLVLMMTYLKTDSSKATMMKVSSLLKWVMVAGLFSIFMMV